MKRVLFGVLLASTVSLFVACEQDSLLLPADELIAQIASSDAKIDVSPDALPVEIAYYIETNYAPLAVESAAKVRNLGFEVLLENNYCLYFNQNQECLGGGNGNGGHHPRPHRGCMRGDTIDLATLPTAIYDYVAAIYPDETIVVAVQKLSGKFGVELSDGTTMIFDADGVFITLCGQCPGGPPPPHGGCMRGDTVTIAELPQAAQDFVTTTYPDLTIQTVVVKPIGAFAVELSDGTILLFNPEGVFFRLCGEGPGGPGGPGGHGGHGGPGGHGGHGG